MASPDIIILLSLPSPERLNGLRKSATKTYYDKSLKEQLSPVPEHWKAIHINEAAINLKSIKEVIDFGHQTLDGQSVIDRLQYQEHTYWYHLKFRIYHKYRSDIARFRKIETVLKAEKHSQDLAIKVLSSSAISFSLFFPNHPKLQMEAPPTKKRSKNRSAKITYLFYFVIRILGSIFQLPTIFSRKKNVLLVRPEIQKKIIHPESLEYTKGDHIIEYLLQKTAKEEDFIFLSDYYPPAIGQAQAHKGTFKEIALPKYRQTIHFEAFFFLSLLNPITYLGLYRLRQKVKELPEVEGSPQEVTILNIVKASLPYILLSFIRIQAASLFLRINRPRTVSGTNEHDQFKAFPLACKSAKIPFIAFQHGAIAANSAAYIFSSKDLPYKPNPTHTLCWGYSWQNVLTQDSSYPPDTITALGQIRTDIIPRLQARPDYPESFSPDRPVIVYCSQPLLSTEKVIKSILAADFFKLSKAFPDAQFILKPHPLERDWDFFYDIAKEVGTQNFKILDNDLYQLINIADMIITYHSTVGIEAVYFGKPILVADYNHDNEVAFGEEGIGFKFSDFTQLRESTARLLSGKFRPDTQAQEALIRKYAFAIDGKTTDRYIDFIRNFKSVIK